MPRKTLPARITYEWLKRRGACKSRLRWFRERFPRGVGRITVKQVEKAGLRNLYSLAASPLHWIVLKTRGLDEACPICNGTLATAADIAKYLRDRQRAS